MLQTYIPSRGDIVWLEFTHQVGHEQTGQHPALTISPCQYNQRVVKSLDWKIRKAKLICKLPNEVLEEVLAKIETLID